MVDPGLRLKPLLAAWKRTRAARVGALVDLAGVKAAPAGEPVGAGKKKADHAAWLALAKDERPEDLARLLATLCAGSSPMSLERLDAVARQEDPRIATRLLEIFAAPPYTAKSALPFYLRALEVLVARGDERHAQAAAALAERYLGVIQTSVGELLQRKLKKAAEALAEVTARPLSAAEEKLAGELEAEWAADRKHADRAHAGRAAAGKTQAELLAEIHAHPEDDAARLVYADWLSERQDPAGELIVLQIARARGEAGADPKQRWDREVQIIQANQKKLYGPLGMVATDIEIRRGFPAVITVGKNLKTLKKVLADPAWRTIEELTVPGWWRADAALYRDVRALLASPELRALQKVRYVPVEAYFELRARGVGARWDAVSFADLPADPARLLAALGEVPRWRELGFWLRGTARPAVLELLLASPLARRIDALFLTGGQIPLGEWIAAVEGTAIPELRWEWGIGVSFARDRVRVRGGSTHSLKHVLDTLAGLPRGKLTEVAIRPRSPRPDAPEGELAPVAELVRERFPGARLVIEDWYLG